MIEYTIDLLKLIRGYLQDLEYLLVAACFGLVNALIRPAKSSIGLYFIEFIISVVTATLVGFIMADIGASKSLSYMSTAIAAILARDILNLIIGFGNYATNHKEALYNVIWQKLLNKSEDTSIKEKDATNGKRKQQKIYRRGRRIR